MSANWSINWQADLNSTSAASLGKVLTTDGTQYLVATSANYALYPSTRAIVIGIPNAQGIAPIQFNGDIAPSITGLSPTSGVGYGVLDTDGSVIFSATSTGQIVVGTVINGVLSMSGSVSVSGGGILVDGTILHAASAAVGDVVTTTAVDGIYQLATAANLSTDRAPVGLITVLTTGATYDTITVARGGLWDATITGLSAADPGYVRLDTATATLVRDNTISDTEWLMGWADPVPTFSLVVPARPGLGGGSVSYNIAGATEALGTASGLHTYDTTGGTVQTFTLPVGAAEATNHELRAKSYPEGTVVVTPPTGGTIDGLGVNVSKTFRALASGFALMCLGANAWESRIVPGADMTLNARDFGHIGNGVASDAAAIERMIATSYRMGIATQAGVTMWIPPTAGGTIIDVPIRGFKADNTGTGYIYGSKLVGGLHTSSNAPTQTTVFFTQVTRMGGAGVSVTAITVGPTVRVPRVTGFTYARLAGFPAATFPATNTVGQDIQLAGCNNGGILDGRAKICKRISDTSVEVLVPSTVTNGTTVGTWKVLDYGFEFWSRDCEVSGFNLYTSGASCNLRAIFNITMANGAGAGVCTGNLFKGLSCYASNGSKLDYLFELAKNIVPQVGFTSSNGNYADDGGGISCPVITANCDVMTFDKCLIQEIGGTGIRGLLQCESFQKQARQIFLVNNSGCIGGESIIQCDPVFDPTLDNGNWSCSIGFVSRDCVASVCSDYIFKLGVPQSQDCRIDNIQYEGAAGLVGYFNLPSGYTCEMRIIGGYHVIADSVVALKDPFIQTAGGITILESVEFSYPDQLTVPSSLIGLYPGCTIHSEKCLFPSDYDLNGADVYSWSIGSTNGDVANVTEINCFQSTELTPWREARRTRIGDTVENPDRSVPTTYALVGVDHGQDLIHVRNISGTFSPMKNAPFYVITMSETAAGFSVDYPDDLIERDGDLVVADVTVLGITGTPDPLAFQQIAQRSTMYWHGVDFAGSPGVGASITFGVFLRRQTADVTPSASVAIGTDMFALYEANTAKGYEVSYGGGTSSAWHSIDASTPAGGLLVATITQKPTYIASDASFNNRPVVDWAGMPNGVFGHSFGSTQTGAFSVLCVAKAAVAGTYLGFWGATNPDWYRNVLRYSGTEITATSLVGAGPTKTIASGYDPGTSPAVILVIFNGASSKIYANAQTVRVTGTLDAVELDHLQIHAPPFVAGCEGKYALVQMFNRALTDDECKALILAAGAKFNITIGP